MSTAAVKISRQNKATDKERFEFLIDTRNYEYLYRLAQQEGISMSAMLNRKLTEMRMNSEK